MELQNGPIKEAASPTQETAAPEQKPAERPRPEPPQRPRAVRQKGSAIKAMSVRPAGGEMKNVIAKGTQLLGDIAAAGDLDIYGEMYGNLSIGGHLKICGILEGDAEAQSIEVLSGRVKGNLRAVAQAAMDKDSVITGQIHAGSLLLDGNLKGNIWADAAAVLDEHAVLLGNVTAAEVSIGRGARLQGRILTMDGNPEQ